MVLAMHRSKLGTLVIDCDDIEAGEHFWTGALGTDVRFRREPYVGLRGRFGGLDVLLQHVPEPKTAKSRIHVDFWTDDLEAEVARLETLGARRQRYVEEASERWWILEDPCGNEFCVFPAHVGDDDFARAAQSWQA